MVKWSGHSLLKWRHCHVYIKEGTNDMTLTMCHLLDAALISKLSDGIPISPAPK